MVYQECCEADEDGPVSAEWISRWCTCSGGKLHKRLKKDANRAAQETAQEAYRVAENNIESIIETLEKICDWKQSLPRHGRYDVSIRMDRPGLANARTLLMWISAQGERPPTNIVAHHGLLKRSQDGLDDEVNVPMDEGGRAVIKEALRDILVFEGDDVTTSVERKRQIKNVKWNSTWPIWFGNMDAAVLRQDLHITT